MPLKSHSLFELSLASSLRLLFLFNRRLLIMFPFAYFLNYAISGSLSLKTLESAIKRFILFNLYLAHLYSLPPLIRRVILLKRRPKYGLRYYTIDFRLLSRNFRKIYYKKFLKNSKYLIVYIIDINT